MIPTREIYWNVGNGSHVTVPMYLVSLLALAILVFGIAARVASYRRAGSLPRFDRLGERMAGSLREVLSQRRVMGKGVGMAHALLFWSFLILLAGTLLVLLQADFTEPLFRYRFLEGTPYLLFSLALDLAGLVALCSLPVVFFCRYPFQSGYREIPAITFVIYGLLFFILGGGFLLEGARIAATELPASSSLAYWSSVGFVVALALSPLGESGFRALHLWVWWSHLAAAAALIALVPFSMLRHLLAAPAAGFFSLPDEGRLLPSFDLEREAQLDASRELSPWKNLLEEDACTGCRRCQDRCPAYLTEKALSPMKLTWRYSSWVAGGMMDETAWESAWSCATCRSCEEICPVRVEHVRRIVGLRRTLVLGQAAAPQEIVRMFRNLEFYGDPIGAGSVRRTEWMDGLSVGRNASAAPAELVYWVGCAGAFDDRYRQVARSVVRILESAGVPFSVLGSDEACCGDFARRLGNEYLYRQLAGRNLELIEKRGVTRIVTSCPHCLNVLRNDYAELGSRVEVVHHSELVGGLLRDGRLKIARPLERSVVYHDSCYLGRFQDIYDEPREVLRLLGAELVEASRNRKDAFCCGGGGGLMWRSEPGRRINEVRGEELLAGSPEVVATACPYCLYMLQEGVAACESAVAVETLDLAEIVARVL